MDVQEIWFSHPIKINFMIPWLFIGRLTIFGKDWNFSTTSGFGTFMFPWWSLGTIMKSEGLYNCFGLWPNTYITDNALCVCLSSISNTHSLPHKTFASPILSMLLPPVDHWNNVKPLAGMCIVLPVCKRPCILMQVHNINIIGTHF